MSYSFWDASLHVLWVSEEDPADAAARMAEKDPDLCCVTPTRMLWMIHTAVTDERKDEFYRQFCTPERLLIAVTEPDAMEKDALQFELSVILSVRRVEHRPTRFIFPPDFDPCILQNQSVAILLHMADRGVPLRRLQTENSLLRCLARLNFPADDSLSPEEEDMKEDANTRMLREIEAKIRILERKVARLAEKDIEPF